MSHAYIFFLLFSSIYSYRLYSVFIYVKLCVFFSDILYPFHVVYFYQILLRIYFCKSRKNALLFSGFRFYAGCLVPFFFNLIQNVREGNWFVCDKNITHFDKLYKSQLSNYGFSYQQHQQISYFN